MPDNASLADALEQIISDLEHLSSRDIAEFAKGRTAYYTPRVIAVAMCAEDLSRNDEIPMDARKSLARIARGMKIIGRQDVEFAGSSIAQQVAKLATKHSQTLIGTAHDLRDTAAGLVPSVKSTVREGSTAVADPTSIKVVVGQMSIEDIRKAHPDLSTNEIEAARKQLSRWAKTHEDECTSYVTDGSSNASDTAATRTRYMWPTSQVETRVNAIKAKRGK